jgi:hypothetical protein
MLSVPVVGIPEWGSCACAATKVALGPRTGEPNASEAALRGSMNANGFAPTV